MSDRKWNNQGGSNFDAFTGKYKKPKELLNIPQFEDLKESNSTSFNYKIPPKPAPQLGNFGDEIWTYSPIDDSPAPYIPFIDLTPKDPRIPKIKPNIPTPSIPKIDPKTSSTDLFPFAVINEYEIVVKFGLLVLRISSGQAYAARQGLNDPKYDFALVIKSSNSISLGGNAASTTNLINVSNSAQNPIYSLYNWLNTKLKITTNNDATGIDSVLAGIDVIDNVSKLPSTQFVSNGFVCGLFYAEGIQPDQICLNATNKVFKFEPAKKIDPTWTVTYPGQVLPLCLDIVNLQIISIKLIPPTLNAINRGSGIKFIIRIARDATIAQLAGSLEVDIKITSPELLLFSQQLDPALYATTNITNVGIQMISATIPALAYFVDLTIEPLAKADKLVDVPLKVEIISSNVPDSTPDYKINGLFMEVNMIVNPNIVSKPIVSVNFAPGSLRSLTPQADLADQIPYGDRVFVVRVSIDKILSTNLFVGLSRSGTAATFNYTIARLPGRTLILDPGGITINAGSLFTDVEIFYDQPNQSGQDLTIILSALSQTNYTISNQSINAVVAYLPILSMSFLSQEFNSQNQSVLTFQVRAEQNQLQSVRCLISLTGTYSNYTKSQNLIDNNVLINGGQSSTTFSITAISPPSSNGTFLDVLLSRDVVNYRRRFPLFERIV